MRGVAHSNIVCKVKFISKTINTILTLWVLVGVVMLCLVHANFLADWPFLPNFSNINKNKQFDICRQLLRDYCNQLMMNDTKNVIIKLSFNTMLLYLFWAQHIILSKYKIKQKIAQLFPEFLVVERSMFNLSAIISYLMMLYLWQPIDMVLFQISEKYRAVQLFTQYILAAIIYIKAKIDGHDGLDYLGVRGMIRLWSKSAVTYREKFIELDQFRVSRSILMRLCRHPLYIAYIIHFTFSGLTYTYGRVFFILFNLFGILQGTAQRDRMLAEKSTQYAEYMSQVKNKFIPDLRRLFPPKKKESESDGSSQEAESPKAEAKAKLH